MSEVKAKPLTEKQWAEFRQAILESPHPNYSCESQFMKRLVAMVDELKRKAEK